MLFAAKLTKKAGGAYVGSRNWQTPRPTGQSLCSPSRVRFVFCNPFVTQFGRGTTSPAYKYKGHGRLRSFYPIESNNLHFFYFSSNPSFSNLVLFFTRLDGVQGRLGGACRSQDNPRSSSFNGVPPELEVLGLLGALCAQPV